MCGIAGFLNISRSNFQLDPKLLEKMQQTIAHRGPDGYRVWTSKQHQIGLAHRRLSILDLSQAGFQPLFDAQKTVAVCCNGEIYNYQRLRSELESYGHVFTSQSDTEVIVHGYKQWGIDCLERLEGMFAIVIFDLVHDELYLVRDRIGIKPLYFSVQSGVLSFASEIKALWELPWNHRQINVQGMYHYLTYMVTPAPMTLYEGIYKLPPAYYLKVDKQREVTFHEWYNPLPSPETFIANQSRPESFFIKHLRSLLRESVQKRLQSDVPFGAFLSGGVDSSLIVALMSEYTDNLKTFNVAFEDGPEFSEITWARKIARKFGTDHHEIIISEKEAFEFFEKMVHHQDEPLGDCVCVPVYYVSKLLKDSGVTVALVGEGADELFCGYAKYADYIDSYYRYWKPTQKYIPAFAKQSVYQIISLMFPQKVFRRESLKNWAENKNFFWSGACVFPELWKQELMFLESNTVDPVVMGLFPEYNQAFDSYAMVAYHLKKLKKHLPNHDFEQSITYLDLTHRLPELLLMRIDKMAMATSVEGRVPFLDHHMVEFALSIPSHLKYKNGTTKYVLKKAAEGIIPQSIIYRKKVGFAAPTARWFKTGKYFPTYFEDMVATKRRDWEQFLNVEKIVSLSRKNQNSDNNYGAYMWVLQNLIAVNI